MKSELKNRGKLKINIDIIYGKKELPQKELD